MRYITLAPSNVGSANPLAGLVFCGWMKVKVILSAHRNPSYHTNAVGSLVVRTPRQGSWRSRGSIPPQRHTYSHRPSKRTGPTVNRRLVGAVPTMGVYGLLFL